MLNVKKKKYYADEFDHDTLSALLPFYCAWLDDGTGEPCPYSVMLAPVLFSLSTYGTRDVEDWKN
jgi:hypothetical protein